MNLFESNRQEKSETNEQFSEEMSLGILSGDKADNVFAVLSRNFRLKNHASRVFERCLHDLEQIDGAINSLQLNADGSRSSHLEQEEDDQLTWADAGNVLTTQCGDFADEWVEVNSLGTTELREKQTSAKRIGF